MSKKEKIAMQNPDTGVQTQAELFAATYSFSQHYSLVQNQSFTNSLNVNYNSLKSVIVAFAQAVGIGSKDVGLTFIHRFDADSSAWFICIELCELKLSGKTPDGREIYNIIAHGSYCRYDLTTAGLVTTTLPSAYFDQLYYNNLLYRENPIETPVSLNSLDPGKNIFVKNITFPWKEIKALYDHNDAITEFINPVVCLQSCSSDLPYMHQDSNVNWPHGIWMYMKDEDSSGNIIARLGTPNSETSFYNQAADVGSMCPPRCAVYLKPSKSIFVPPPMMADIKDN